MKFKPLTIMVGKKTITCNTKAEFDLAVAGAGSYTVIDGICRRLVVRSCEMCNLKNDMAVAKDNYLKK